MPLSLYESLAQTIYHGLRRKSIVDCSAWAMKFRILSNPYPGLFTFTHFPWTREVHNCEAEKVVVQKAAQLGFTEYALNRTFYTIDIKKVDTLYVLPSQNPDAAQFSAARFNPALELSPYLTTLFSAVDNVGHKRAGATNLYIRGSRSRSALKSVPVGLVVLDELDEMTQENLSLIPERQAGQRFRQEIAISTPTAENSGINARYKASTQNHFHFKCPKCSRITELIYPDCVVICGDRLGDPAIRESHIRCKECKNRLDHETKHEWLINGYWVPAYPTYTAEGFYINQLYSSTESPPKIAEAFHLSQTDLGAEQEFHNSKMGIVHEIKDARVKLDQIESCIKDFRLRPLIEPGRLITMGCDQGINLHYEIDEWIPGPAPAQINDFNLRFIPKILDHGVTQNFEDLDRLMKRWHIISTIIDAQPERRKAMEFASRFPGRVYLCMYPEGLSGRTLTEWTNEPVVSVDRTSWLDLALGRFKSKNILLPKDISTEYKNHIQAPVRTPGFDVNGNPIARYITAEHVPDHFAHARNYAEIALALAGRVAESRSMKSPR